MIKISLFAFLSGLILVSCQPEKTDVNEVGGRIHLKFSHLVNEESLVTDSLCYVNEAGNPYLINDVMYFISDVYLYSSEGEILHIDQQKIIHYVDIHYDETLVWKVFDPIPEAVYDSISFVFGLSEERNISFMFVNPPEVNMFWPTVLGGGYHYMMINGKWKNEQLDIVPFDFHLGIGQIYSGNTTNTDSITGFAQNYFEVTLPLQNFEIKEGDTTTIEIAMNIDSWFRTPHIWDFNYWGGAIMQNQEAMNTAKENGFDVFEIVKIY